MDWFGLVYFGWFGGFVCFFDFCLSFVLISPGVLMLLGGFCLFAFL